jgi:hypothetical protein
MTESGRTPVRTARRLAVLLACLAPAALADGIEHIVFVWLNEPGNAAHRQQVLAASAALAGIPGVTGLRTGQVVTSTRPVVDSSYDVGLIVSLEDQAALDDYLVHPLHVQLVEDTLRPLVKRIRVYDLRR